MELVASGVDVYEAGKQMGISPAAVERRYTHATSFASYQTKKVQTA